MSTASGDRAAAAADSGGPRAAVEFRAVDILFSSRHGRRGQQALQQALAALDAGGTRADIAARTGVVVGVAGASLSVAQGEIWINNQQMSYVMDALAEVPTLRVVNSTGRLLLTPREEQVVALVADGLSNRDVADELGLSEHTIKKYLLRIFDKLGVSSRVELVLYAISHGENRPAEWMPGSTQIQA